MWKKAKETSKQNQVNKTSHRKSQSKAEIYERKRAGIAKACLELQPLTSAQAVSRQRARAAAIANYTL